MGETSKNALAAAAILFLGLVLIIAGMMGRTAALLAVIVDPLMLQVGDEGKSVEGQSNQVAV